MINIPKSTFYVALAGITLASCKTLNNITIPAGTNTVIDISEKKAELTDFEKDNWHHLDLATDTIPGMSVNKAYALLKDKKGVEVIVGVIDTGTDLKHEDLKDVAWFNTDEIADNGIDDDKNGYVDDIHGWNFLGETYDEHLEYERILMNPSITDQETYDEAKAYLDEKIGKATDTKMRYQNFLSGVLFSDNALKLHLKKEEYTFDEVREIITVDPELSQAVNFALNFVEANGMTMAGMKEELEKEIEKSDKTINGENLKTDYRTTGDNAYDINDKPGYGDGNIQPSEKDEAHGSHVSGIIGATRDNKIGMNGVANNVKIMAIRSVSNGDEYDKDVALGIRYAVDNGAKVINTSFGKGFSPNKEWVYDAIKYAAKKDVLIVNAAGNDGADIDVEKTFPNDAPDFVNEVANNFLTVGAMSYNYNKDLLATFSNYGQKNVDVFAPGVQIHATTPEGEYKKFSGTSMASPATAGVAALIRSYYPQLTANQVKQIIMNTGTQINFQVLKPGSQTDTNRYGDLVDFSTLSVSGRIVNAYNALKMAEQVTSTSK